MGYNPKIHHRRSIRLPGFDYAQPGEYFITLCSYNRLSFFGIVREGVVDLNWIGKTVEKEWTKTSQIRSNVELDAFVVMPDHFHAILRICGRGGTLRQGEWRFAPTMSTPFRSPSKTVGSIVRGFKSATTKRVNLERGSPGLPLWQRNYYEHIIRDEADLVRIRDYIRFNASQIR